MNPVLRILAPHEPPVEYVLDLGTIRVGRVEGNDIVLKNARVSALHLELRREGDGFRLLDRDSTNGTQVNGAAVTDVLLRDGDEILIGGEVVALYTGKTDEATPPRPLRGAVALPPARPPLKIASPTPPLARKPGG
jgi:pSer/pThr/pTyr-binding forkhead associated (FHA) protein